MTPNEQPTRWEKTAETTNPAVIAEMTTEEPPNSLHIERLTPNTYCIITPDHTHYIHAPTTGRDATVRLIAHGHDPRDPDVEMTRDRDDHRSIDTMWDKPQGKNAHSAQVKAPLRHDSEQAPLPLRKDPGVRP